MLIWASCISITTQRGSLDTGGEINTKKLRVPPCWQGQVVCWELASLTTGTSLAHLNYLLTCTNNPTPTPHTLVGISAPPLPLSSLSPCLYPREPRMTLSSFVHYWAMRMDVWTGGKWDPVGETRIFFSWSGCLIRQEETNGDIWGACSM